MPDSNNFFADNTHIFNGMYRARVDNNGYGKDFEDDDAKADEFNRNRVQVRVLGLHSFDTKTNYSKITCLPWAEQANSLFGGLGPDNKAGIYQLPEVGSWVWIWFDGGNYQKPIYFATIPGNNDFDDEDQYLYKIKTKSGTEIIIQDNIDDDEDNLATEISIKTKNDTSFTLSDKKDEAKIESIVGDLKLSLDNKKNSEQILIEDGKNSNTITLNKDGVEIVDTNDNTIKTENGKITVDNGDSNIILDGTKITLDNGTTTAEYDGGSTEIKNSSGNIKMDNNGTVTINDNYEIAV